MIIRYYQIFQFACLALSILFYSGLRRHSLQLFMPLMAVVCLVEVTAVNSEVFGLKSNYQIYNVYVLLSTVFYFLIFRKMIRLHQKGEKVYLLIALLTMIFLAYDFFFIEGMFNSYSVVLTLVQHIVLSFMVLSQLSMEEKKETSILAEPYFWIATGILLFAIVSVVVIGLQPYILKRNIRLFNKSLYRMVMPIVNVVLYSCYSYAFYLCGKHRQRFLPS